MSWFLYLFFFNRMMSQNCERFPSSGRQTTTMCSIVLVFSLLFTFFSNFVVLWPGGGEKSMFSLSHLPSPLWSLLVHHAYSAALAKRMFQIQLRLLLVSFDIFGYCTISVHGGAGIAKLLERQTRDQKVPGSSPRRSGRRIFFSRINFLC